MKCLVILTLFAMAAGASGFGTATLMETSEEGSFRTDISPPACLPVSMSVSDGPLADLLWHYTLTSGWQQRTCPMGNGAEYVFTGGWYGGGIMFEGATGDGSVLWQTEPDLGTSLYWKNLGTGVSAAWDADRYYLVRSFDVWNDNGTPGDPNDDYMVSEANLEVCLFSGSSSTPLWVWDGTGTLMSTWVDEPGKYDCTPDGEFFAVGGYIDGHLGIAVFVPDSAGPYLLFDDPAFDYSPRQLRITDDGSSVIFSVGADLLRVDVATGTLEDTYNLGASTDCFDISGDGSLVAYGFTAAKLAQWNGSQYDLAWSHPVSGYYAGAASISDDGQAVYHGFYRNTYLSNRIYRFDPASSTPVWTYDTPAGSGGHQDVVSWMDCTSDGSYLAVASWGCQTGGGDEVIVLDDDSPSQPVYSINSPGSMWHVDISPDGAYVTASGKHVHANVMGSGTDTYMADITPEGLESGAQTSPLCLSLSPNPCPGTAAVGFSLPGSGAARLSVYDLSGRRVHQVVNEYLGQGEHTVQISTDLPAGLYVVTLSFGSERVAEKLLISR